MLPHPPPPHEKTMQKKHAFGWRLADLTAFKAESYASGFKLLAHQFCFSESAKFLKMPASR